jgi:hypothetical protein
MRRLSTVSRTHFIRTTRLLATLLIVLWVLSPVALRLYNQLLSSQRDSTLGPLTPEYEQNLQKLHQYRKALPVVRMADRRQTAWRSTPIAALRPELGITLPRKKELSLGQTNRGLLSSLHNETSLRFIAQFGFGSGRMWGRQPTVESFLTKPRTLLPQPGPAYDQGPVVDQPLTSADRQSIGRLPGLRFPGSLDREQLQTSHRSIAANFVFENGWGYERKPGVVAAFTSHHIGEEKLYRPDVGIFETRNPARDPIGNWRLSQLHLIGLVQHETPTVYLTEHLPQMVQTREIPTRAPDAFESAALAAIADGDELYIGHDEQQHVIRFVGGLRAGKDCISCHGCQEGQLLGAFSYTLRINDRVYSRPYTFEHAPRK